LAQINTTIINYKYGRWHVVHLATIHSCAWAIS